MNIDLHIPTVFLSEEPLNPSVALQQVYADECGAVDMFIGTVRNQTKGKRVNKLVFEAYESMAIKEMEKIESLAREKWPIHSLSIHHRVGLVKVGEIAVIIAVATPHRAASFEACRFVIDTLKETVPIWKKEFFDNGEIWVAAHP